MLLPRTLHNGVEPLPPKERRCILDTHNIETHRTRTLCHGKRQLTDERTTHNNARALTLCRFAAEKARNTHGDVTASLHIVVDASSPAADRADPGARAQEGGDLSPATSMAEASSLLRKAARGSPAFAGVTALPPGTHILCYLPPSEAGERLTWQESCLRLLEEAASDPGFRATLPLPAPLSLPERRQTPPLKGWALVPCAPSENLICALARGGWDGGGGRVAWFHSKETGKTAVADDLLLTS